MSHPLNSQSPLDPGSTEPIYWRFGGAISDGVLAPGERSPTVHWSGVCCRQGFMPRR